MKTSELPKYQNFHLEGVKHIAPSDAIEAITKHQAVLIDVREENELLQESFNIDQALHHPMSSILDRLQYISKDQNIILACEVGERSTKVANLFNIQEYPNVANLDGGLKMWKMMGLPVKTSNVYGGGCSGCSSCSDDSSCY
jgi:rhodanese-related sulfurtransferase